jgi:hypothetical protein
VSRIVLLVIVALFVASSSDLWAGTYTAAQELSDLSKHVPVTIAASAVSNSECFDPVDPHCPLPLVQSEFS